MEQQYDKGWPRGALALGANLVGAPKLSSIPMKSVWCYFCSSIPAFYVTAASSTRPMAGRACSEDSSSEVGTLLEFLVWVRLLCPLPAPLVEPCPHAAPLRQGTTPACYASW